MAVQMSALLNLRDFRLSQQCSCSLRCSGM